MISHIRPTRAMMLCLAVLVVLLALTAGCSSGSSGGTGGTQAASTSTIAGNGSTSTSALLELSKWDKQLKETAAIQNELANVLMKENAAKDDPRMGILYGLSACSQAIACRQALDRNNLRLADAAIVDVRYKLNLARAVATGSVAQTIAAARAILASVGIPSEAPDQAAATLDQFIAAMAPLSDAAGAEIPSTTTTLPTTTTTTLTTTTTT